MPNNLRAGTISVRVNDTRIEAKGDFTYRAKIKKRDAIVGRDDIHGYKEEQLVPFIEGATTDSDKIKLKNLCSIKDATVTVELVNGKTFVLRDAWYAGEGTVSTGEGEIGLRFEGMDGDEV